MFKKTHLFLSFVFIWAGFVPLVWAGDRDVGKFMFIDEIKPGMRGYGLTVFSGTRIDTFDVDILGVMRGITPKGDLILARMSGGPLEKTGIYGGMSGSPIYIDGRLIGAAAYGWFYAKEPIGGITPIGEMLDVWTVPPRSQEQQGSILPDSPGRNRYRMEEIPVPEELMTQSGLPTVSAGAFLRQWSAPVAISGFDERIVELMTPMFEQYGLTPIQGGGASTGEETLLTLQPGSTVAAQLISGDASVSVVGTVTYIEGDKVLAFGHPMFRAGGIDLPMSGGIVHVVFPSQERSFKMAAVTRPIGSFRQDRRAGTGGLLDSRARVIPCEIHIDRDGSDSPEIYRYEVAYDRLFTPSLVGWTTSNSYLATERLLGRSSIGIRTAIKLGQDHSVTRENFYSGDMAWLQAAADAAAPLSSLMDNPFEEIRVEGVTVDIYSEESMQLATIDAVRINKLTARPGDSLTIDIIVKPYLGPTRTAKTVMAIPENVPDGPVQLLISDAKTAKSFEKARAPHHFRPENLDQLISLLETEERNNEIVAILFRTAPGLVIQGEEFPSLPSSLLSIMTSSKVQGDVGLTKGAILAKARLPMDCFISGNQIINIRIDRMAP